MCWTLDTRDERVPTPDHGQLNTEELVHVTARMVTNTSGYKYSKTQQIVQSTVDERFHVGWQSAQYSMLSHLSLAHWSYSVSPLEQLN